ncbi:MAG: M14 family zinc carboxypeptidase [Solirubrobacteraceae bacterium]
MGRVGRSFLLMLVVLALWPAAAANAQVEPPWCGTPMTDAAENLPDGTDPNDPEGSFPHIPHYAIGCTLERIEDESDGRMEADVIGRSALGRDMYGVVINELETRQQRRDYRNWLAVRALALKHPRSAQRLLQRFGDDVKVPVFIQGGIHGNEYEGVEAAMDTIDRLATTPYGEDRFVDEVLDHLIVVFNPIQNPDGRIAGTRQNGNGFDLNRDYLTQSQSETRASVTLMKRWLPPEVLDLHGYVSPTLIEATTKPHNPSIEYDLWLKWNQSRIDANEEAVNGIGRDIQRPINDWCADTSDPPPGELCEDGSEPGPAVAEGWDDWGPFYTAMYAQHVGLDSSTVEMCRVDLRGNGEPRDPQCGGRAGARDVQIAVEESTLEFVAEHREDMFSDMLEIYRRGDEDAPRPECCPPPFDVDNNWMLEYPKAYVIPVGQGQRSDAEANRLVEWLLFNDIEVHELKRDTRLNGQELEEGSYVAWLAQPRRGLLDTAMSIGVDISERISILYAPPAAWSHGYLWGADVVTVADEDRFSPSTKRISRPNRLDGGVERSHGKGRRGRHGSDGFMLEIDSPTAVRALNALVAERVEASLALEAFSGGAAGTAIFAGDRRTERLLDDVGRDSGLTFRTLRGDAPESEPIEKVPRFRVFSSLPNVSTIPGPRVDQSVWVLRELGFDADPVNTGALNSSATDPLAGYDLIYNAASTYPSTAPANATARARLSAFFANGGGYIGGQSTGANFLNEGGQATGLEADSDSGDGSGYSGILFWDNTGGANSLITGAYPARDTLIADPPTWLTSVPANFSVDGRLPETGFFASGLWPGSQLTSAPGDAVIAHGTNTANTARLAVFASNPLYRADPEREWPMVGTAAYWADN